MAVSQRAGPRTSKPAETVAAAASAPAPVAERRTGAATEEKRGSLIAVGTGIRVVGQLTLEAIASMKMADKLLYCVGDPIAEHVVKSLNASAESMFGYYAEGKPRAETYEQMIQRMLECVRQGLNTCVALYGHPGVFAWPAHEAIRRARAEGYQAKMLPAVSAEDCLFADVGIDPAMTGCQSYEATDFMINSRVIDTSSIVILWQIGVVGDWSYKSMAYDTSSMPLLMERLSQYYQANHQAIVYEAAVYPGCSPVIRQIPLFSLPWAGVTAISTLCIPPARAPLLDPNIRARLAQYTQR
jgi:uncharacterized protein YabN with tetrapyrrole methylase and pyrophosphatase domain